LVTDLLITNAMRLHNGKDCVDGKEKYFIGRRS
jgi:hypothetical protein